jgi:hydroxyacylglutathione hydrolase
MGNLLHFYAPLLIRHHMLIRQFFTSGLAINSYLIFDEKGKKGALIDPTRNIEPYLSCALQESIEITDILETHVHADFISGAPELKAALYGKPVIHCSAMGGKKWIPKYADKQVRNRDRIKLGSLLLEAWHTPGHTREHVIWIAYDGERNSAVPEAGFTGDLLFVGSVGRPDLCGPEEEKMLVQELYTSLFTRLQPLPDFLEIFPSHGEGSLCGREIGAKGSSTLGYERQSNPWMIPEAFEKWSLDLLKNAPAVPDYFHRMKQQNLNRTPAIAVYSQIPPKIVRKEEIDYSSASFILDIRPADAFASAHIKGSVNIPFLAQFASWAAAIAPPEKNIFLVLNHATEVFSVAQALRLVGIDWIHGVCEAASWKTKEGLISSPTLNAASFYPERENYYIIDVRTPAEWHHGHVHGAHHLELAALPRSIQQLPQNIPLAVMCRSGNRASIAASFLMQNGFTEVVNIRGGMQDWTESGFPVIS